MFCFSRDLARVGVRYARPRASGYGPPLLSLKALREGPGAPGGAPGPCTLSLVNSVLGDPKSPLRFRSRVRSLARLLSVMLRELLSVSLVCFRVG